MYSGMIRSMFVSGMKFCLAARCRLDRDKGIRYMASQQKSWVEMLDYVLALIYNSAREEV